jgi:diguanylate cyclase (GGDEF)-like protein
VVGVVIPIALVCALIAGAVALLVGGGGQRAAEREVDARAATVKKSWDAVGQPTAKRDLRRLGLRLGARLRVTSGSHPEPGKTTGDVRRYAFATHKRTTLLVALSTKKSSDAISAALIAGLIIGIAGIALLAALLAALLRGSVVAPLRSIAAAAAGGPDARASVSGAREVRTATARFNEVADRAAQLNREAGTDLLTGLPTGPVVREAIAVEMKRAQRDMTPMAVVFFDIDNFKTVNDAHGKQAGDALLKTIVDHLKPALRATDFFARVAGDEFAYVLPKSTVDHVEMVIARSREALAGVTLEGFVVTVSAGYACFPSDGRDLDTLCQAAEGALRLAQKEGGATKRFDPSEVSISHQEGDRHEVVAVIEAPGGITPVFQPLVALATGQVAGYEALTRFKQPPKRFPDEWFNLAARVGMGGALEAAAIKKALDTPGRPPGAYLSLNLSPSTLLSPEVQDVLPHDLTGLVIEVTEHELATDDSVLATDLIELRARGARIAVDDAGAGYSGLQQLMRVQPDLIKLDRSLVQNIHEDTAKQALVDSFVRFGRRTGAQVVAEGIETEEELRVLADLDVTYGQGYFLAKPGPPWAGVSPWVSEKLLRRSLGGQMSAEDISNLPVGSDQRLAAVAARVAHIATMAEVEPLIPVIADEMGADELVLFNRSFDGSLVTLSTQPWLPNGGRLDIMHFPAMEGVLRTGDPEQILAGRGSGTTTAMGEVALLANSGFRSMLAVPVGPHALMMAFLHDERPWSRAQINRALVLAYQLAPLLAGLAAHAAPAA